MPDISIITYIKPVKVETGCCSLTSIPIFITVRVYIKVGVKVKSLVSVKRLNKFIHYELFDCNSREKVICSCYPTKFVFFTTAGTVSMIIGYLAKLSFNLI